MRFWIITNKTEATYITFLENFSFDWKTQGTKILMIFLLNLRGWQSIPSTTLIHKLKWKIPFTTSHQMSRNVFRKLVFSKDITMIQNQPCTSECYVLSLFCPLQTLFRVLKNWSVELEIFTMRKQIKIYYFEDNFIDRFRRNARCCPPSFALDLWNMFNMNSLEQTTAQKDSIAAFKIMFLLAMQCFENF